MLNRVLAIDGTELRETLSLFFDELIPDCLERDKLPLIAVGEYHGTTESPALVGDLVEVVLEKEGKALLLVELPISTRDSLQAFLSSPIFDPQLLFVEKLWRDEAYWGITSLGMLGLLERVRQLKMRGADIHVEPFDARSASEFYPGANGEERLAIPISALLQRYREYPAIIYTGDLHARARVTKRYPNPSACQLAEEELGIKIVSIQVRAKKGGEAWGTLVNELNPRVHPIYPSPWPYEINSLRSLPLTEEWDCVLMLESFSASPRACPAD